MSTIHAITNIMIMYSCLNTLHLSNICAQLFNIDIDMHNKRFYIVEEVCHRYEQGMSDVWVFSFDHYYLNYN